MGIALGAIWSSDWKLVNPVGLLPGRFVVQAIPRWDQGVVLWEPMSALSPSIYALSLSLYIYISTYNIYIYIYLYIYILKLA